MMTALAERPAAALTVTPEQLELITRTVAHGATPDELQLYLHDCARQGVHPLDKLIFFTKRGGKYTPITSIDFMRLRAAETNEYAGSDDASFHGVAMAAAFTATVTVWRLVQGQRCGFTATARWPEYCPPAGQDHMWRRMPHAQLAKCAEALALRKGFPRQLAGLQAIEEVDRAEDREDRPRRRRRIEERPTIEAATQTIEDAEQTIDDGMRKRLFERAEAAGWTRQDLRSWFVNRGIVDTRAIVRAQYDALVDEVLMAAPAAGRAQPEERES